MQLTSELWYWNGTAADGQNYVTLSRQPQSFNTNTNFEFDNDSDDRDLYAITFNNIQNTNPVFRDDYKILCHADCQDTNYLLIARDFDLVVSKLEN